MCLCARVCVDVLLCVCVSACMIEEGTEECEYA